MRVATAVFAALILAACGGSGDDEDAAPTTSTSSATSTTSTTQPQGEDPLAINWDGDVTVELDNGWTVGPCEGGPRPACIRDGEETLGTLELLDSPVVSFAVVQEVLDGGGTAEEALRAYAEEFSSSLTEDRAAGCGPGYALVPSEPEQARVGGHDGLTFGFDATLDGEPVERAVQWATIDEGSVWIATIAAAEVGTCGDDPHLSDLDLAQLAEVEAQLAEIVANTPLPEPLLCVAPGNPAPVPCEAVAE